MFFAFVDLHVLQTNIAFDRARMQDLRYLFHFSSLSLYQPHPLRFYLIYHAYHRINHLIISTPWIQSDSVLLIIELKSRPIANAIKADDFNRKSRARLFQR